MGAWAKGRMEACDRIPGQCNAHAWLKSGAIHPVRRYPFARAEIFALPDPASYFVVVFIAESSASDKDRAAMIAEVARAVGECSQ